MVLSKQFRSILLEIIFISLIVFVFLLVIKILPFPYSLSQRINLYDGGIVPTGAKRILHGEIPYKDFWTLYAPLNYIQLSAVFKFFGESLYVVRIYNIVISLFGLLSIYWLFRTKTNRILATITSLLFLFFLSPIKSTHLFLILTLIAIFALIKSMKSPWLPYVCGVCAGLTFTTRLDFGILVSLIFVITTIILSRGDFQKIIYYALKFLAGFLLVILPIFLWLSSNKALMPFWEQVVYYPFFGNFADQRYLPMPNLLEPWRGISGTLSFVFNQMFWAFIIIFWATLLLLKSFKRSKISIFFFGLLFIGSLPYMLHRSDSPHLIFINILGLAFFYYAIFSIRKFKIKYFLAGLIVPILLFYYPIRLQLNEIKSLESLPKKVYSFYSEPLSQTSEHDALEQTIEYIKENIDEPIYIGVADHSKIFVNNVMLYFLIQNEIPTSYHELHPGVATTEKIQKQIIDEINGIGYIILWSNDYCEATNDSCNSSGVYVLDEYIKNNYVTIETIGEYQILRINPKNSWKNSSI